MNGAKMTPPPFSLRLTAEERAELDRRAGGRPLGEYIRSVLFGGGASPRQLRHRKPNLDQAALGQALGVLATSHLASNMNQIAKAVNMGALPVTPELSADLSQACADIQTMRHELVRALRVNK